MKYWSGWRLVLVGLLVGVGFGLEPDFLIPTQASDDSQAGVVKGGTEVSGGAATVQERTQLKPQPFVASGVTGSGETVKDSEARRAGVLSDAEIAKLPTIEKLLGMEEPETVCGADSRTQRTDTTNSPWRMNCQLIMTLPNGKQGIGTGWMSGRGTVMTAGHCVNLGGTPGSGVDGLYMRRIDVIPGRNGTGTGSRPFGTHTSSSFRSVNGWVRPSSGVNRVEYDYGAVILSTRVGDSTGFYGFANLSDASLNNLTVNSAGYPGDKPTGTQWYTFGPISSTTTRQLFYNFDTFGGQSGSAVYRLQNGQRHSVGVHAYGGCPNGATRVTTSVFNNMLAWRNLTQ